MNQGSSDLPRPLRIAMVVPPWYELPPPGYGGLEQVCSALVDALSARGHRVTLFGAGEDTGTDSDFVATSPQLQYPRLGQVLPELAHLARTDRMITADDFDVVHDHTTAGPLLAPRREVPTVATIHGLPSGELGDILTGVDRSVGLVAISEAQRRIAPELAWAATIHHGLPATDLRPAVAPRDDRPVLWLARFSPDKGPDIAIRACREAGLPLVLAGKSNEPAEQHYLAEVIEPMVGPGVTLIRNPDREETVGLLQQARCLIMPIRWQEPFGMVMLEAMAVGTPVVAMNRGAAPELVSPGETGLICDDEAQLPQALREVTAIDPVACVRHVRESFSADLMARRYEQVYRRWAAMGPVQPVGEGLVPSGAW